MATCRGAHGRGFPQGANHVDDTLYGLDGNDTLDREAGNDSLNGMFDNDTLHGGKGNGGQPDRGEDRSECRILGFRHHRRDHRQTPGVPRAGGAAALRMRRPRWKRA